ncbi:MAG: nickel-binding protein [Candidatus Nitrosopolaris sp.]
MPRFLDVHSMKGLNGVALKKLQNAPADEFGIKHLNIMYNPEVDQCYRLIEAPTMEAVQKHHDKFGIKCDWIIEVKTTS